MNTLIIFPPQFVPFHVYPSLPALQQYLKERGQSTQVFDANVDFYNYLLSNDFLEVAMERVRQLLEELPRTSTKRPQVASAGETLARGDECAQAVNRLRDKNVFENGVVRQSILGAWDAYLGAVSTIYAPVALSYRGLKILELAQDQEAIANFCSKSRHDNLFWVYYSRRLRNKLASSESQVIALSLAVPEQLVPAITLCAFIKSLSASTHTSVGGPAATSYGQRIQDYDSILGTFIDSVILHGTGEHLCLLLEALRNRRSLTTVPNLVFRAETGITRNRIYEPLDLAGTHGKGDYSGLDLRAYFHYAPAGSS